MENTTKQEAMENALISYESGFDGARAEIESLLNRDLTEQDIILLSEFSKKWQNAPCDDEGPNHEQDELLDSILSEYSYKLLS